MKSQSNFRIAFAAGNSRPSSKMSNEAPRERKVATAEQARETGDANFIFFTDLDSVKSVKSLDHFTSFT